MLRLALAGFAALCLDVALATPAVAAQADISYPKPSETVAQTACRLIESAAQSSHVPVAILTRLVWSESRFQAGATSAAGAQGIAQFMPQTAVQRGLSDPFDPEQAIPQAAALLADLEQQFGNFGLATAAYNAGPSRLAGWLGGSGSLPFQTRAYVFDVTGRSADDWAAEGRTAMGTEGSGGGQSCTEVTAALRAEENADPAPIAPWGVQLAGNFSRPIALASFGRAQQRYSGILGDLQPMIVGTVMRSRGTRRFYRVLLPAESRAQAERICGAIIADGGACVALRT